MFEVEFFSEMFHVKDFTKKISRRLMIGFDGWDFDTFNAYLMVELNVMLSMQERQLLFCAVDGFFFLLSIKIRLGKPFLLQLVVE